MFNSPDGMMFDNAGIHWIQTYGDDANEGNSKATGNIQMLAGDPVEVRGFMTGPQTAARCSSASSTPISPFPDGNARCRARPSSPSGARTAGLVG